MSRPAATLLIDAGNTRVKFGLLRHGRQLRDTATLALGHNELDHLQPWLATLPEMPEQAVAVSVAGQALMDQLELIVEQNGAAPLRWLRSTAQAAGITNRYDQAGQLGNDRWVALIGLSRHTPQTAVLASFGTATTIDTLGPVLPGTGTRCFEGGLILPGPELMRKSLAAGTAGLPYAEGGSVAFPRNTHDAIGSGIAAAQAGAVLRQWRHALENFGAAPALYCSGGGWPMVADEVQALLARAQADLGLPQIPPQWLEAPVLDGLARLATEPQT